MNKTNKLSIEELLQQVDKNDTSEVSTVEQIEKDNLLFFISFYNINTGDNLVSIKALFNLYTSWSKQEPIDYFTFKKKIKVIFANKGEYLLVDTSIINLSLKAKNTFFDSKKPKYLTRKNTKKNVEDFIVSYGFNPGEYILSFEIIYSLYKDWCKLKRRVPLESKNLFEIFKYYFKWEKQFKKTGLNYLFYINNNDLKVDGVTLEKAQTQINCKTKTSKKKITSNTSQIQEKDKESSSS